VLQDISGEKKKKEKRFLFPMQEMRIETIVLCFLCNRMYLNLFLDEIQLRFYLKLHFDKNSEMVELKRNV
jgi:hypothetical protein